MGLWCDQVKCMRNKLIVTVQNFAVQYFAVFFSEEGRRKTLGCLINKLRRKSRIRNPELKSSVIQKKSAQENLLSKISLQWKRSLTWWSINRSIKNLWEGWVQRQKNVPYWQISNWRWTLHPSLLSYVQQTVSLSPSKPFCRFTLTIESVHTLSPTNTIA